MAKTRKYTTTLETDLDKAKNGFVKLNELPARLRPCSSCNLDQPGPGEIVEALDSGECPRCGMAMQIDSGSGLCWSCSFAF